MTCVSAGRQVAVFLLSTIGMLAEDRADKAPLAECAQTIRTLFAVGALVDFTYCKQAGNSPARQSSYLTTLKCLRYLFVTVFRPPPGGPMAVTNCKPSNFLNISSCLSYQPP